MVASMVILLFIVLMQIHELIKLGFNVKDENFLKISQ